VSIPSGAQDNSAGEGSGANSTWHMQIDGISIAAGGSATVAFDVTIAAGTPRGTLIENRADITNPGGIGAAPSALPVIVSESSIPGSGNKPLYLYRTSGSNSLSRTRPTAAQQSVTIYGGGDYEDWVLSPVLAQNISIDGSTGRIPVQVIVAAASSGRTVAMTLYRGASVIGTVTRSINNGFATLVTFDVPVTVNPLTVDAGQSIRLRIQNNTIQSNRSITVYPATGGNFSLVNLNSLTVINVDQVAFYSPTDPGGSPLSTILPGQTVYIRATVSDPFGSYDITSARLRLTAPDGSVLFDENTPEGTDLGIAQKVFEFEYTFPSDAAEGIWTARVTAEEGSEGSVRDTGIGTIRLVRPPDITVLKSVVTESDPINGGSNPKAIPGATMVYTITVQNHGGSGADSNSVVISDPIDDSTDVYLGNFMGVGPVRFSNGAIPSGLSYFFGGLDNPVDDLEFFDEYGNPYTPPLPLGADGYDSNVRQLRINPKGIFNGVGGVYVPSFTLQFRVRVK
jgi:trimeric autotransporter adhesin